MPGYQNNWATVHIGDAKSVLAQLPAASCHAIITSPPYWNLRAYLPAGHSDKPLELGTEAISCCQAWLTAQQCGVCYLCRLVAVFDEVRRVLRHDGACFVVIADSYAGSWGAQSRENGTDTGITLQGGSLLAAQQIGAAQRHANGTGSRKRTPGLKPKDLCGIPQRFALAMQAAEWWWRSEIIWAKPSPMPESVTDRPTRSHEQVLMFTKAEQYYWDSEAVKEVGTEPERRRNDRFGGKNGHLVRHGLGAVSTGHTTRNLRTVWDIPTTPYTGAHFATFPSELVRRCLLAATSERGCCTACAAPWVRVVERYRTHNGVRKDDIGAWRNTDPGSPIGAQGDGHWRYASVRETKSWTPSCDCFPIVEGTEPRPQPVPCCVLDPFAGSGTVLQVASQHLRRSIGIDLNGDYLPLITQRLRDEILPFGLVAPGKE